MLIASADPLSQVRGDEPKRPLPAAELSGLFPKNAKDLRALQAHTREVVEKVIRATVAVEHGSGVIVSEDGYVVTAGHIAMVAGRQVPVILHDGRRLTGVTLGVYRNRDAALVKITDKGRWPFAPFADPATVKAGSWCLGIGHPHCFRVGRTPVVRLGRVLRAGGDCVAADLITDGGDSGGPLFDLSGNVLGIDHGSGNDIPDAVFYASVGVFRRHWDRFVKSETWGEHRSDWSAGGAPNQDDFRANAKILTAFRLVVADARKSTVRIRCGGKLVALGTLVEPDGRVLTRLGALKGDIEVLGNDDQVYKAQVVGVHPNYDLAMLKIDAKGLPAVRFADANGPPAGHWVASVGIGEDPIAYGVVSVAARDPRNEKRLLPMAHAPIWTGQGDAGVVVGQVLSKKETDLEDGDVILRVGRKGVADPWTFTDALRDYKAGDTVELTVRRGKVDAKAKMRLVSPPEGKVRYPSVLQHDAHIRPDACGGPLVDLDGRMIGLNIARPNAYQSYAIPVEALKPLLRDLASGKLAPRVKGEERKE
jgi:serine protease Do